MLAYLEDAHIGRQILIYNWMKQFINTIFKRAANLIKRVEKVRTKARACVNKFGESLKYYSGETKPTAR